MNSTTVIVNHVSVTLQGNDLLNDVSFQLHANEHLAVIGPSGSGKTTLAKVLARQLFAKGSVVINYDESSSLQKKVWLTEQRNRFKNLSHTPDFYYQQRFNSFDADDAGTVWQELEEMSYDCGSDKIELLLKQFGLLHRGQAPLIQLSSGENKRFQLVKAILAQPQILILDSPFTGLDAAARKKLANTINELSKNIKIIIVTSAQQVPDCITYIALLEEGRLKQFAAKEKFDFGNSPLHPVSSYPDMSVLPIYENKSSYRYIVNMKSVHVQYDDKMILNNINWTIKAGEKWLLKGHNGAGKSTLLSLINGDNPQAYKNEIYLFDKRRGSGESIWDIKQKIGFVSPELHAFYDKSISCCNTIASGFFDTIGLFKKMSEQQKDDVASWIDFLQLQEVKDKPLASLSFGTQRLILLARALVKNPLLLILDEPCQGLDEEQKDVFIHLVNNISERFSTTLIYVSHYDDEVPDCIEKIMELKNGGQKVLLTNEKAELIR